MNCRCDSKGHVGRWFTDRGTKMLGLVRSIELVTSLSETNGVTPFKHLQQSILWTRRVTIRVLRSSHVSNMHTVVAALLRWESGYSSKIP